MLNNIVNYPMSLKSNDTTPTKSKINRLGPVWEIQHEWARLLIGLMDWAVYLNKP